MSDTREPMTEVGRRLADDIGYHAFMDGTYIEDRIVAIETEARQQALDEVEAAVKAERLVDDTGLDEDQSYNDALSAVLTALAALRGGSPNAD